MVGVVESILRFVIVFVVALSFGLWRQRSRKPIGFGTFTFVSTGACALAIIAITVTPDNPLALLAAIVSGIGFLGAGALIKTSDKIFGFTSAASIWVFAIFGLSVGAGGYLVASAMFVAILLTLGIDKYLEARAIGGYQRKVTLTANKMLTVDDLTEALEKAGVRSQLVTYAVQKNAKTCSGTFTVEGRKEIVHGIPEIMRKHPWLLNASIE